MEYIDDQRSLYWKPRSSKSHDAVFSRFYELKNDTKYRANGNAVNTQIK